MKHYGYFRSSAAYRCRIAFNLKGLEVPLQPVHLLKDGGEQLQAAYRAINPQGLVPALQLDDDQEEGQVLGQSLAIIEYLEEVHPSPALLPRDPVAKARVRAFALAIACDIHPLNNLRVLKYLKHQMSQPQEAIDDWYRHWVEEGLQACEKMVADGTGPYCFGDAPGLADLCLVPQLYNARRFSADLSGCPRLLDIDARCAELPAFAKATPEQQPDATA
ncbi:maleylacetoacetate isomerase [Rhodovibrionaceae bacterium A322]